MPKPQKPTKTAHQEIDSAIDESMQESPDSANAIAERLDRHVTQVARRLQLRFVWRGGRWVRRKDEEQ